MNLPSLTEQITHLLIHNIKLKYFQYMKMANKEGPACGCGTMRCMLHELVQHHTTMHGNNDTLSVKVKC